MKRSEFLLTVAVSTVCAALVSIAASVLLHGRLLDSVVEASNRNVEKLLERLSTRQVVLIAKNDVSAATALYRPDDRFYEREQFALDGPKDAIKSLDDVEGRVLDQSLTKGQILREADLKPLVPGGGTVALRLDDWSQFVDWSGAIAGSRVDVILKGETEPVASRMLIVVADIRIGHIPDQSPTPGWIILEGPREQITKIREARTKGKLLLKLRHENANGKD